jgi:hypothetical protein
MRLIGRVSVGADVGERVVLYGPEVETGGRLGWRSLSSGRAGAGGEGRRAG